MSACNVEVIKNIGKYLNTPVGPVCFNTSKVLTTVLDKDNVEGFATIVMRLAARSCAQLSSEQALLSYQWLEHIAMFGDQAASNPTFSKGFLQDINKALQKNSYLTGQFLTVADIAAYHVLYPLLERLSVLERESILHVCRWSKHIQAQPRVCTNRPPLHLNTLTLSVLAPATPKTIPKVQMPLPRQILPHELARQPLTVPVLYHPQPLAFPGYPVILYSR